MVLFGIGQIGCSPNELAQRSTDGRTCVSDINDANQIFNNKLKSVVDQFNNQLPDARVIYINAYGIFQDIIANPATYGNLFFPTKKQIWIACGLRIPKCTLSRDFCCSIKII